MSKYMKSYHKDINQLSRIYEHKQHDLDKMINVNRREKSDKLSYKINSINKELADLTDKINLLQLKI